jgi:hypothetical protein
MEKNNMTLWNKPGIPHKGWSFLYCDDLLSPDHVCDMCGKEEIRYVHIMEHKETGMMLKVGCVCAGHMMSDYALAKENEKEFKNKLARRETFMKKAWLSQKGRSISELKRYSIEYKKDTMYVSVSKYDPNYISINPYSAIITFQMSSKLSYTSYHNSTRLGTSSSLIGAQEIIFEHIEGMKGY